MRPGITIQHASLPDRPRGIVRGDVAGMIAFLEQGAWPEDASAGDFAELVLRRASELDMHPLRARVDPTTRKALAHFFENGGDTLHLYMVCVERLTDLKERSGEDGPLTSLYQRLLTNEDLGLLAVPSAATWRCEVRGDGVVTCDADALWDDLLALCRTVNHRFLVIDAPRGLHGPPLFRWAAGFRARYPEDRAFGAVYYPFVMQGEDAVPPSGAMMGLMAKMELARAPFGIAQPPANVPLAAATHTEVELDWGEVAQLSEAHINPLISQAGRGVVAFGARTLSTDPAWIHINSRRVMGLVTEQLRRDNEWAVFETNEPGLWKILERDVLVRLREFWEAGLISGTRALPEYSVRCDAETNPMELRDAGGLSVEVRMRPVGTTESILVDLRIGD